MRRSIILKIFNSVASYMLFCEFVKCLLMPIHSVHTVSCWLSAMYCLLRQCLWCLLSTAQIHWLSSSHQTLEISEKA